MKEGMRLILILSCLQFFFHVCTTVADHFFPESYICGVEIDNTQTRGERDRQREGERRGRGYAGQVYCPYRVNQ